MAKKIRSEPSPQAAAKSRAGISNGPRQALFGQAAENPVGQGKCWKRYGISVCHFRKLSRSSAEAPREWGIATARWLRCGGQAASGSGQALGRNSTIGAAEQGLGRYSRRVPQGVERGTRSAAAPAYAGALSIKNETSAIWFRRFSRCYARSRVPSIQADAVKRILDPIVAQRRQESEYQAAREAVRNAIVRFLKKNYPVEVGQTRLQHLGENVAEAIFENGGQETDRRKDGGGHRNDATGAWSIGDIAKKFHIDPEEVKSLRYRRRLREGRHGIPRGTGAPRCRSKEREALIDPRFPTAGWR